VAAIKAGKLGLLWAMISLTMWLSGRIVLAMPRYEEKGLQSFESSDALQGWRASGAMSLVTDHATKGKQALRVVLEKMGSSIGAEGLNWDLRGYDKLKLDILNDGPPVIVTLKVTDKAGRTYQSWYYLIKTGYNRVEYIIDGFASAMNISQISSFNLRIDAETPRPVTFYMDNIRITRGPDDDTWLVPQKPSSRPLSMPGNLIQNPSFEMGFENWGSWGEWDGGQYTFGSGSGADAHSGDASAAIICQKPGRGGIFTAPIKLPAPGTYRARLYVKGKDGARFRAYAANGELEGAEELEAPDRWTEVKCQVRVTDPSQPLRLYVFNVGTGILYVDDIALLPPVGVQASRAVAPAIKSKPPKITLEGDVLQVNGRPFFPVGMYGVTDPKAQLAGTAFNLVTGDATGSSDRAYLDSCAEAGVFSWVNLTGLMRSHLPWKASEIAAKVKNHPAVLGWYLCDEPDHSVWNVPPPDLRLAKKVIAKEDKGAHPAITLVMAWTPSNIYQYRDTCDILASDPYCLTGKPPHDLQYVSRTVDTMRRAVKDAKPVWAVLQAGWDDTSESSREEQYAMTYLAVAHGADGIFWFALDSVLKRPDLWETLKKIANELQKLTPVLTSQTVWIRQGTGHPALHAILKETKEAFYLIAVNVPAKDAPQEDLKGLKLPIAAGVSGKATVLFENREISVKDGALIDNFRLYERHVYRILK